MPHMRFVEPATSGWTFVMAIPQCWRESDVGACQQLYVASFFEPTVSLRQLELCMVDLQDRIFLVAKSPYLVSEKMFETRKYIRRSD